MQNQLLPVAKTVSYKYEVAEANIIESKPIWKQCRAFDNFQLSNIFHVIVLKIKRLNSSQRKLSRRNRRISSHIFFSSNEMVLLTKSFK